MTKDKRREVLETLDCDTERLYGTLDQAIAYLKEVRETHPQATLEEHWTGYQDMEMRFSWSRPETDEEMQHRVEQERAQERFKAEQRKKETAREERRKQYLKLQQEFG
jgi:hypothetical protein